MVGSSQAKLRRVGEAHAPSKTKKQITMSCLILFPMIDFLKINAKSEVYATAVLFIAKEELSFLHGVTDTDI